MAEASKTIFDQVLAELLKCTIPLTYTILENNKFFSETDKSQAQLAEDKHYRLYNKNKINRLNDMLFAGMSEREAERELENQADQRERFYGLKDPKWAIKSCYSPVDTIMLKYKNFRNSDRFHESPAFQVLVELRQLKRDFYQLSMDHADLKNKYDQMEKQLDNINNIVNPNGFKLE